MELPLGESDHRARPVGNCAESASTGCDAARWRRPSERGGAMTDSTYQFYLGVDWATEEHRVIVLDADRRVLHERTVRQEGVALEAFATWVSDLADGRVDTVAVALEVPRGAVVETLLARGCHVFAINPKQLDRFRDRYTVAGAKDDRRDARVLADALATDRPAFRRLAPEDPRVIELREVSRLDTDLRDELRRLANRLLEQLSRFFPQMLQLCPAADEPWLWALLERAPTPGAAAGDRAPSAHALSHPARRRGRCGHPPAHARPAGGPGHRERGPGPSHRPAAAPALGSRAAGHLRGAPRRAPRGARGSRRAS